MRRWRGAEAVADTETLTDPLPANHLSSLVPSSSPSISAFPVFLYISCLTCLYVFFTSSSSCRRYHLSSSYNTHLQTAAAVQRASVATVSKILFDWRMLSLVPHMHVYKGAQ